VQTRLLLDRPEREVGIRGWWANGVAAWGNLETTSGRQVWQHCKRMSVHCEVRRTTPAAAADCDRAVSTGATQRVSHSHSLKYHNPHRRPLESLPLFPSPAL
jgi:hypothetical protein